MISEEIAPTLGSLHAEILELKRSVAELRTLIAPPEPLPDRELRVLNAKREIFSEYDSLLRELAK